VGFNWIVGKFVAGTLVTVSGKTGSEIYMWLRRLELSVGLTESSKNGKRELSKANRDLLSNACLVCHL
jgi:hypothetical protein